MEIRICGILHALMKLWQALWVVLENFQLGSKVFGFRFCKDQSGCLRRDAFKEGTIGDAEIIQDIIMGVA